MRLETESLRSQVSGLLFDNLLSQTHQSFSGRTPARQAGNARSIRVWCIQLRWGLCWYGQPPVKRNVAGSIPAFAAWPRRLVVLASRPSRYGRRPVLEGQANWRLHLIRNETSYGLASSSLAPSALSRHASSQPALGSGGQRTRYWHARVWRSGNAAAFQAALLSSILSARTGFWCSGRTTGSEPVGRRSIRREPA